MPLCYTSPKHPVSISHGEHVLSYLERAATKSSRLPTIVKGLAAVHLGGAVILYPTESIANGDQKHSQDINSMPLTRPSKIRSIKRLSRFLKGHSNNNDETSSVQSPSSKATVVKLDQRTVIAADKLNDNLDIIDPSFSASNTGARTIEVISPCIIPQETTRSSSLRINIFSSDISHRLAPATLPAPYARIDNTLQLVHCCNVLSKAKHPPMSNSALNSSYKSHLDNGQQKWAGTIDHISQDRYYWLVSQLAKEFAKDPLKDSASIAEVVLIGSILDESAYRALLSCFILEFENRTLLDIDLLQGLVQLVECASDGYIVDSDLVKITIILSNRLSTTHARSEDHHFYLAWALSRVLDVMVTSKVKDLNRDRDHQPLLRLLSDLKNSGNIYLKYQAAYAHQALLYVPDDETPFQVIWRYVQGAAKVVSVTTSISSIDSEGFLDGIDAFAQICGEIAKTSVEGYKAVGEGIVLLREGVGKAVRTAENSSESINKRSWYLTLQGTALFIQQGRFSDLNLVVSQASCRNNADFQWGICRQLGEVAVDPLWDLIVRQQAINFLGELYKGCDGLQPHRDVKRWILSILIQISNLPEKSLKNHTTAILKQLQTDGVTEFPEIYPLSTRLSQPEQFPLLSKVQNIPKLEYDLHILKHQRISEYNQPIYIAPMAKANIHAPDDTVFPLMDKVREFIAGSCQVMLILGDSGAGKSTFNRYLEHELWLEYSSGGYIPLYINIPALENPVKELIQEQLKIYNFTDSQIHELKLHRQFILICDGYDEGQLTCNLHTTNLLNQSGQYKAKMIITCRSHYLGSGYRERFVPSACNQYYRVADSLFQECVITSFSNAQIDDYVERYIPSEPRNWVKSDYMEKLETIPNLMDLVRNPFLLTLCLEALPSVVQGKTNLANLRVTRVQLYDSFVQHWLKVNKRRLQDVKLEEVGRDVFELLLEDGFEQNCCLYQKDLAASIFREQNGHPIVNYAHLRDRHSWKARYFGPDHMTNLLRESSLLIRVGTQYRFVHRSILEYFYSRTIREPIISENNRDIGDPSEPHNTRSSISNHPLSERTLVNEPSIIQFLAERAQQDYAFEQELFAIIEQSKQDELDECTAIAAANAITIMVKAGRKFTGLDLRGVRIPGANLVGGEFDSALLQGADLTNVNFTKAWLRQADFSNAKMSGVSFGELPYLSFKHKAYACAYSPDGSVFATGLGSGEIAIYGTNTWVQVQALNGHTASIESLTFSRSGDRLLSGSRDTTVRLWSCTTGSVDFVLEGHTKGVTSVAYSPSGKQVASGSEDKTVRLWDADSGTIIFVLTGHITGISGLAYSPDGLSIVSTAANGPIRIFDIQTGQSKSVVDPKRSLIKCIAYSPDGTKIVMGHFTGELGLWESNTYKELHCWKKHNECIYQVAFSPDGQWIATGLNDKTVKLWDAQTGRFISSFTGHKLSVNDIAISPDGLQLASASLDKTVRLWDISTVKTGFTEESFSDPVMCIVYSFDAQYVYTGTRYGSVRRYNALSGESGRTITCEYACAEGLATSPDNSLIATIGLSKNVCVWDVNSGLSKFVLTGHTKGVNVVVFSPCGRWIATGSSDKTIRLWDAGTGTIVRVLESHMDVMVSLRFSSNGQQIISTGGDGAALCWEVNTGICEEFSIRKYFSANIGVGMFSPNYSYMLSEGPDSRTLHIWDQLNNSPRHILKHDKGINSSAWSHCEKWFATGCEGLVFLWHITPDEPIGNRFYTLAITELIGVVGSIAWKPDALEFVVCCHDGSARAWRLVEISGIWSAQLVWRSGNSTLAVSGARFSEAIGLSATNRRLLEQRSQDIEPLSGLDNVHK